jgi:hypothetical protein
MSRMVGRGGFFVSIGQFDAQSVARCQIFRAGGISATWMLKFAPDTSRSPIAFAIMRGKTTYSARAENTHGFGQLSKNDFMLSHSTASVWSDEAGGGHDRDRLPVQSRLALGA